MLLDDVAILDNHYAVQVLTSLLDCRQILIKSDIHLLRCLTAWHRLREIVVTDKLDILILQSQLHALACKEVGNALTVNSYILITDVTNGLHLLVIQCGVVEEHICFASLEFIQHLQETRLLLGRGLAWATITRMIQRIFLCRLCVVNNGEIILLRQTLHQLPNLGCEAERTHMARDMAHVRYMLQRHLNLRTRLTLNFCQIPLILTNRLSRISLIGRHHRQEIAILVHKTRTLRQRTPLHIIPLAGDGKVQTYIYARILAQQTSCLGKPRRHDHHLNAGLNTIFIALHTSDIRCAE